MKPQTELLARYSAARGRLAAIPFTGEMLAGIEHARAAEGLAVAVYMAENLAEIIEAANNGFCRAGVPGMVQALAALAAYRDCMTAKGV